LREFQIVNECELQVAPFAVNDNDTSTRGFDERGIVGIHAVAHVRGPQRLRAKRLRRLYDNKIFTIHGLDNVMVADPLDGVDNGQARNRRVGTPAHRFDHRREQSSRRKRTGGVVHDHDVSGLGHAREARAHRFGTRRTTNRGAHARRCVPLRVGGQHHHHAVTRFRRDAHRTVEHARIAEAHELFGGTKTRPAARGDNDAPDLHEAQSYSPSVVNAGEQQPACRRRHDRRDLKHHFRSADELAATVHDNHRTVVEMADTLARLFSFARQHDADIVAGTNRRREFLR